MSFRSRSTTTPIAPPRRRSSSLTRSTNTTPNGYASASAGSARPYSVNYGNLQSTVVYQPQNNYLYGSNQNLRLASGSSYYDNGLSNGSSRRNSFGIPSSALTSASSYKSPYKDKYSQHGSQSYLNNAGTNYTSAYKDRYYSPYTSYDNGVTTASLSIPMNGSSGSSGIKRDYTPMRSNLLSTSSNNLGGSSQNLSINDTVASIGRSQSLREHERKSRTRKSKAAVAAAVPDTTVPYDAPPSSFALSSVNRSLSALSLRSEEGYESGNESRSRINSVTSSALNVDTNDDGEFVDYKALYEAAKAENDKLKGTLKGKEQDLIAAKTALERLTAAATKSSLSENEKREKRAMERKISEMEEELKQMDALKTENQRLKDENGALIRVISKLSK